MPMWLVKYLIALAFFPPILGCLCLLFLAVTWHQVAEQQEEESYAEG